MTRVPPAEPATQGADLQDQADLLRAIFDGIGDGLLLVDGDGTVLAANQVFAALCGARADDMVGSHWLSHCAGAGSALPRELIEATLADGLPRSGRLRFAGDGGAVRILDMQTQPLTQGGRFLGRALVHLRDVTERVTLESQMLAAERFTANRHLAAVVAHEVNTPLQAIESCLHLAGRLADAEQRGRYLSLAREEIQRVGHILRQLIDLYRPSHGVDAPIDLNALVERSLLLVGPSLSRQGIAVERDLGAGLPALPGRADELTQVLLNLILNALQAMGRGGRLTVRTRHERPPAAPPQLTLTVGDTGPGVAAAVRERIFEPFFTTKADGTGLGLAVSQQIVAAHGGAIELASAPGEGASFRVILPLEREGDAGAPGRASGC